MIGHELNLHSVYEKYYFDEFGYIRNVAAPVQLDDEMLKSIQYKMLKEAKSICFVGDSITEGTKNGGVPWYEPMESFIGGRVENVSIGGATTKTLLRQEFLNKIISTEAELYVIAIGTNDVRYRNGAICAMTEEYVKNLSVLRHGIVSKKTDSKFIFVAPWTSTGGDKISKLRYSNKIGMNKKYSDALRAFCENNRDIYIDPNVAINSHFDLEPHSKYLVDWIHPNAVAGVKLYSECFWSGKNL